MKLFKDAKLRLMSLICWMMMSKNVLEILMMRFNVVEDGEKFMIEILKLLTRTLLKNGIFRTLSLHQ